jgi:hypothetical protein
MNRSKGKARPETSTVVTVRETKRAQRNKAPVNRPKSARKGFQAAAAQSRAGLNNQLGNKLMMDYARSLADPFKSSGCKLGWGCLISTTLQTLYVRANVASNADGSLAIALYPNAKNMLTIANGGAAVSFATSATKLDATDQAAITANFGQGRVVSMGLKAFPNLAQTTSPGTVQVGAIPGSNVTLFEALTPNDLVSAPTSTMGPGIAGALATSRPQDTDSFNFSTSVVNGTGFVTTTDFPHSIPYLSFSGIGNATTVFIEAVVNIECIQIVQHSSVGIATEPTTRSLSDYFPSVESMYSLVRPLLPNSGVIGTIAAQAGSQVLNYLTESATTNRARSLQYQNPRIQLLRS